ncbi:PTS transporter subunit IIC [Escherichia coli]
MNDIAHTLYNIVQYILGFGPTVMLPLVLFILALCFKVKPAKALRSSLTVGIGFVGIYAIFDILTSNVGPAAQAMVERTVLAAIPVIIADLWIATKIAPFITGMAKDVNFKFAEGSSGQVSSFLDGGNPFRFWLLEIFNGNIIAIGLVPVIALVLYGIFRMTRSTVYA